MGRSNTGCSPTAPPPRRSARARSRSPSWPRRGGRRRCRASARRWRKRSPRCWRAGGGAGVGRPRREKIAALRPGGETPAAVKLKAKFPPTLIEVTRVPGVGPKTARRLFDELDVATLEDLRAAAEGERIREMKGLGAKAEENVLAGLERLGEPGEGSGRVLLSMARPIA